MYEISKFVILIRARKKYYNIYVYILKRKKDIKIYIRYIYIYIFYNQTISEKIAMLKFIGIRELENNQQIIHKS